MGSFSYHVLLVNMLTMFHQHVCKVTSGHTVYINDKNWEFGCIVWLILKWFIYLYSLYVSDRSQDILLSEVLTKDYLYTFSSNNFQGSLCSLLTRERTRWLISFLQTSELLHFLMFLFCWCSEVVKEACELLLTL